MFREIWKPIPGYEGYMVSDLGRVKSLNYYGNPGLEMILKPGKGSSGYLQISLFKDGIKKTFSIHRLVWISFNGPIPNGIQINHLNEDITDNRLENLSLATPSENTNWGTRNRRAGKALSKMVEQHTLDGIHICTWFSVRGIERELGYNQGNITECCLSNRKTAYGYKWKYK